MSTFAIRVEGLSKQYRIGAQQAGYKTLRESLTEAFVAPFRRAGRLFTGKAQSASDLQERFWALKDIAFEVQPGEVVGIIGRNGAGKSTLLKILSRITKPTEGIAKVRGRVGSLLEVGTGFHPELTGRENVYLNGAILGMQRAEIERKFDEIVDFSGVEKFLDTPVKFYSSGMYVRLAFAVAAHLEPEVLLVDEVLAVGDAAFQKKCLGKMGSVAGEGRTVLFVSHNMAAVENLCTRAIVLDEGKVQFDGGQSEAIGEYLTNLETTSGIPLCERTDRKGNGVVRFVDIQFKDSEGNPANVKSGDALEIHLEYKVFRRELVTNVRVGVIFKTIFDMPVFSQMTRLNGLEFAKIPPSGVFICRIDELPLPPATFRVGCTIKSNEEIADQFDSAAEITVLESDYFGAGKIPPISNGVCLVKGQWCLETV